jgi:hypothetical protein
MKDFNNVDLLTLVDMLARHTNEYMRMLKDGSTEEEYTACKKIIQNLTAEIEYRKEKNNQLKKTATPKNNQPKEY